MFTSSQGPAQPTAKASVIMATENSQVRPAEQQAAACMSNTMRQPCYV